MHSTAGTIADDSQTSRRRGRIAVQGVKPLNTKQVCRLLAEGAEVNQRYRYNTPPQAPRLLGSLAWPSSWSMPATMWTARASWA